MPGSTVSTMRELQVPAVRRRSQVKLNNPVHTLRGWCGRGQ